MSGKYLSKVRACCGLCVLLMPAAAFAAHAPADASAGTATPATASPQTAKDAHHNVDGLGLAVSTATLRRSSGGTDTASIADLKGTVTGNSADHVSTGSNSISSGSFSGAVGLPTIIQNSGNNVLIQSGVTVNVQFKQP